MLRFDYRSTGDSFDRAANRSGSPGFVDEVGFAVDFVRKMGVDHVAVVGMRIGATFAGLRSVVDPVDALVLWDPCLNGRSFLREQLALGLLIREKEATGPREGGKASHEHVTPFEIPGFTVSSEILDEMSSLDLVGTEGVLADKVLLLTRSERIADRKLVPRFRLANLEHREVPGQPVLLDVQAPTQVVPTQAIATVVDWLDDAMPRSSSPVVVPRSGK